MSIGKSRITAVGVFTLLLSLLLSVQVFGQSTASLSGSVLDASQAVLPKATVTVINVDTGVEANATANNAGAYSFPSLQPGVYNVTARLEGFQTNTKTDVKLGIGSQIRLNFELAVAGTSTEVEVTSTVENMILEAGSSTGTVLSEDSLAELPSVSNDVMDMLNVMGGVTKAENPIFSNAEQTFAGVASGNINVSRDGISVNEVRYASGIVSPSKINQEMVGEFKMILSPVDAEMGRGAGQVQIITKSGSNAYHGSGVWNVQNTALDAEEWYRKHDNIVSPWRNLNNYTISAGGPIIKNRTFFFATWDQQIVRSRTNIQVASLTNCARMGIYRYFAGWNNAAALADISFVDKPYTYTTPTRPVVDMQGNPRYDYVSPTTGAEVHDADTALKFQSVMGPLSADALDALYAEPVNCSVYASSYAFDTQGLAGINNSLTGVWDNTYRNSFDQSGYVERFNAMLPEANFFNMGDGLNTAGYSWTRTLKGENTIFGTGQDSLRKAISVKIDHNINSAHRVSGTYNYDTNIGENDMPAWDNEYAYGGHIQRKPQSFTVALTSTVTPTLLNEFRFGLSRTWVAQNDALKESPEGLGKVLHDLMPVSDDYPVVVDYDALRFSTGYGWLGPGVIGSHPFGNMGVQGGSTGSTDHRWTASDTITWMRGNHSFKGGFEVRLAKSKQSSNSEPNAFYAATMYPSISGGVMSTSPYSTSAAIFDWKDMGGYTFNEKTGEVTQNPELATNVASGYGTVRNLLNYFSGSVSQIQQYFYASSLKDRTWNNYAAGEHELVSDLRNREFAFFFKDDWKVNDSLTLNLGVRYEYYGVPWEENGMAVALKGGSSTIWGACGNSWMAATPTDCTGDLTEYWDVGPNSSHSDLSVWNKDMNNWAPHVGFAWQLPWFGKGKTTLRGGYSISYTPIGNFGDFGGYIARVPGTSYRYLYGGAHQGEYLNLNDILHGDGTILPLQTPDVGMNMQVLQKQTFDNRSQSITIMDDNIRNPYVQNINLSLTRQVGNSITVDVRYIGTLSRKMLENTNINQPNFVNNGLFDAFAAARRGDANVPLLDALIPLGSLTRLGPDATGADQLRYFYGTMLNLASGNFSSVASTLATTNGALGGASGTAGAVLRASDTPGNLIYANPQFSTANLRQNKALSNYHSLQAQITMRPVRGVSFQTTYTWSRTLQDYAPTNYITMDRRYYLAASHRSHTLNSYGTYDLPFGSNGFLFRDASGAFKKAIEGWQLSWIASLTSGMPGSITGAASTFWGNTDPVLVHPELWNNKSGSVSWESGALNGYFYGDGKYKRVVDPQCYNPAYVDQTPGSIMRSQCTSNLKALAMPDPNGDAIIDQTTGEKGFFVFRNAVPGELGNFLPNQLTGPGRWSLDMAMSKSLEFMEGKRLEVRVDAQNIFNHPMPSSGSPYSWNARFTQIYNPDFAINGSTPYGFGMLNNKGGHRTFQAKIRLSF